MSGQSRINVAGLVCSCVTQGVLLGGLLFSGWFEAPRRAGPEPRSVPLVVELLPMQKVEAAQQLRVERIPISTGSGSGRDRQERHAMPVGTVRARATAAAGGSTMPASSPVTVPAVTTAASAADLSQYQRQLYDAVARNSRYPDEARRQHLAGVTRLAFRLDRVGNVLDSWIERSSGSDVLDDAALDALERARPLPPFPAGLPGQMDFLVEIDASLLAAAPRLGA